MRNKGDRFIKKVLFIFIFLLITQIPGYANDDFRGMTWGMSLKDVQKKEKLSLKKTSYDVPGIDIYGTATKTGGMNCTLYYVFAESKLCGGRYLFTKKKFK